MKLFTGEKKLGKFKRRRDEVTGDIVDFQTSSAFYMGIVRELWGASKLHWTDGILNKPSNDKNNKESSEGLSASTVVDE